MVHCHRASSTSTTTATTTTTKEATATTTTFVTSTTSSNRIICLAIIFVILLLPLSTNAAQSRGSDRDLCRGSNDATDCAKSLEARKAVAATRRAAKAKFKFHKIERLDEDNGGEEEDDDDDEGEGGEDNNSENVLNDERNSEIDDGNEADEDDNVDNDNDDDDNNEADDEAENDEDAGEEDDADDGGGDNDEEPSLMSRLLSIFASDEGTAKREAKESESQLPNIISWFNWLTERATDAVPQAGKKRVQAKAAKAPKSVEIDWLTYLKRWPFNSIFPETEETTGTRSKGIQKRTKEKDTTTTPERERRREREQSKSQEEYMELLIHSLPAFIGNVAQVKSGECHQQLELLHQQLRAHKLWTLQMLDATGKIGAGLLRGNINQFGDFDLCTQVSTAVKMPPGKPMRIHGKYCLAQIEMHATTTELKDALHLLHGRGLWHAHLKNPKHFVARYSVANWGICLPHACSAHVVHSIIETSLRPYNNTGIEFHIDVRDEHCTTRRKMTLSKLLAKDNNFAMGIFFIGALTSACVLSTVWQHWDWLSSKLTRLTTTTRAPQTDDDERTEEVEEEVTDEQQQAEQDAKEKSAPPVHLRILQAFSPQRTWRLLVSLEDQDIDFPLIHLLRILATFMVYVNLKFIMAGHLPLTNRDAFVGTVNRYWSLPYRLPLLPSDLLLLLSGFLNANQLSHQMEATCRLSFVRNVATKACRYVPTILAVLGFQTWILPHLGTGPLWQLLVAENARLCEENMWRSALSMQNTADMEDMCSPFTVQLSLDLQLYFLGALIVWLYFTDPEAGFFLCGAFHAMSVAARYSRTQREHLAPSLFHGLHVNKFYRTANLIYTSPITRATSYLLGIGAALLFRSESGVFRIPTRFKRAGWALAVLALAWCLWSPAAGLTSKYVYKSTDAAAYLAWSPLILGLAICWMILIAPLDKSIVQRFPHIARPVVLLSRLEIPLQLASYVVVLWTTASVKEPHQFLMSDLINLQEIACIVLFALIVAFLIDYPAQEIGLLILDFNFSGPLLTQSKDKDGAADDASMEESTELKSDSPEPTDSIWPSESDPEDEKSSE
ncbi:uncharacterized protein LOC117571596 [Drosophila albomicans]|uniref:Uncharacterized protein LOC117571596 n=1 Tax=Drosophila albomicans TaxID=7291 RepID=A0A6P8YWY1_DROAB|nr:uncharacterized protein LOC117571596 [Drosophila albomicans]